MNGDGDLNSMSSKLGLNFNFNLGEEKAWTLGLKPALVYDMNANGFEIHALMPTVRHGKLLLD